MPRAIASFPFSTDALRPFLLRCLGFSPAGLVSCAVPGPSTNDTCQAKYTGHVPFRCHAFFSLNFPNVCKKYLPYTTTPLTPLTPRTQLLRLFRTYSHLHIPCLSPSKWWASFRFQHSQVLLFVLKSFHPYCILSNSKSPQYQRKHCLLFCT